MFLPQKIRIGTRASKLAIAQSEEVKRRLLAAYPAMDATQFEIVPMSTTGDQIQDRTLSDIGGKGLFTKEIEEALQSGMVDIAVHSMKDMPTLLPQGLDIPCLLSREDPRDAFISPIAPSLDSLPAGAVIGTASLRRGAQLLAHRSDIRIIPLRGNVQTRLQKLRDGYCDATLLAVAGLNRLNMAHAITEALSPAICLPAVAQGAIGVECRADNVALIAWLQAIHHHPTALCVGAERAFLAELDGSCRTPIAGLATIEGDELRLEGAVAKPDGSIVHRDHITCPAEMHAALTAGKTLGQRLLRKAGNGFLTRYDG